MRLALEPFMHRDHASVHVHALLLLYLQTPDATPNQSTTTKHNQILSTLDRLVMPSNRQQLSMGTYCAVRALMISCATMPPASEAMLCNSLPPALVISTQICSTSDFNSEYSGSLM